MLVIPSAQVSGSWLCWAWTHQRQIRLSPERIRVSPRSPPAEGRIAQWLLVFLEIVEERRSNLPYPRMRWLRPRQRELPHSQKVNPGVGITRRVTILLLEHHSALHEGSVSGVFGAGLSQFAPRLEPSAGKKRIIVLILQR